MDTQTAMTTQDIQAKLAELKAKRADLEQSLPELSRQAALAMVAGDTSIDFDKQRHTIAEEIRHLGELITGLEKSMVDAAKNVDIQRLEKEFATRKANRVLEKEAQQRLEVARREFREAEEASKNLERLWYHSNDVIAYYKSKLKKDYKMTDVELNQIEAKFKS